MEMFDNRELAVMSMALTWYVTSPNCLESEAVKAEIKEIIRKLDYLIASEGTEGE